MIPLTLEATGWAMLAAEVSAHMLRNPTCTSERMRATLLCSSSPHACPGDPHCWLPFKDSASRKRRESETTSPTLLLRPLLSL